MELFVREGKNGEVSRSDLLASVSMGFKSFKIELPDICKLLKYLDKFSQNSRLW